MSNPIAASSPSLLLFAVVLSSFACATRAPAPAAAPTSSSPLARPPSPSTFDEERVKDDLLGALDGDDAALDRAEHACDEELRREPDDAEALVEHGIAMSLRSWRASRAGDMDRAMAYWNRALSEMDRAVALAPDDLGVRIPRGSALFGIAMGLDGDPLATALRKKAVEDYEAVLRIQGPSFDRRPLHDRTELLWGLADGWSRLGDDTRARQYFGRLVEQCSPSPVADVARKRLEGDTETARPSCKDGCHS
jgi:tetratricopeptide (TPR) repeat protein